MLSNSIADRIADERRARAQLDQFTDRLFDATEALATSPERTVSGRAQAAACTSLSSVALEQVTRIEPAQPHADVRARENAKSPRLVAAHRRDRAHPLGTTGTHLSPRRLNAAAGRPAVLRTAP